MIINIESINDLPEAASRILQFAETRRVFLFYGDMGAGKTTLIKEICKELSVADITSSPTFSIVNEYQSESGPIYHFDFYRIKNETEAFDMGYEDYLYSGEYCFIEWPGKISGLLPDNTVNVSVDVLSPSSRKIIVELK